jgi:hypothetical protein
VRTKLAIEAEALNLPVNILCKIVLFLQLWTPSGKIPGQGNTLPHGMRAKGTPRPGINDQA